MFCCCRCVLSCFCGLIKDILLLPVYFVPVLRPKWGYFAAVMHFVPVLRPKWGYFAAAGVICPGFAAWTRMFCCCRCILSMFCGLNEDILLLPVCFVPEMGAEWGCFAVAEDFIPGKRPLPGQKTSSPGKILMQAKKMPIMTTSQQALFICSCRRIGS